MSWSLLPWYRRLSAQIAIVAGLSFAILTSFDPESPNSRLQIGIDTEPLIRERPYELALIDDGRVLQINGEIALGIARDATTYFTQMNAIERVELRSKGGNVFAARGLINLIKRHHLDTGVTDLCLSACALIFAAGKRRELSENGQLGFHGFHLERDFHNPLFDMESEIEKTINYLKNQGISEKFIAQIFATTPPEMWYPSRAEIREAGVISR